MFSLARFRFALFDFLTLIFSITAHIAFFFSCLWPVRCRTIAFPFLCGLITTAPRLIPPLIFAGDPSRPVPPRIFLTSRFPVGSLSPLFLFVRFSPPLLSLRDLYPGHWQIFPPAREFKCRCHGTPPMGPPSLIEVSDPRPSCPSSESYWRRNFPPIIEGLLHFPLTLPRRPFCCGWLAFVLPFFFFDYHWCLFYFPLFFVWPPACRHVTLPTPLFLKGRPARPPPAHFNRQRLLPFLKGHVGRCSVPSGRHLFLPRFRAIFSLTLLIPQSLLTTEISESCDDTLIMTTLGAFPPGPSGVVP